MNTLLKRVFLAAIVAASALLLYTGCGDGDEHHVANPYVISERQLKKQDIAYVNEEHIVLLSLEHPSSQQEAHDLHHVGSDCHLIRPTQDLLNVELFIEDNISVSSVSVRNLQSDESATAIKGDGKTFFTFKADQTHEFCVTHDGIVEDTQPLFVRFFTSDKCDKYNGLGWIQEDCIRLKNENKCIGCDLSNYDFSVNMPDLTGADISESNMTGSNFYKVILDGVWLNAAILDGADLSRVSMIGARMEHVRTLGKTISNYEFTPTNIDYASFAHSDLSKFDMTYYPRYELYDINFSYTVLSDANIKDRNFSDSDFKGAVLSKAHLERTHFNGVELSNASLVHSFLENVHFYSVNFDESNLTGASSAGAIVRKPKGMKKVQMPGFHLGGADLDGLDISGSNFIGADLSGASLRDATCVDVNFTNAIFDKTDLTQATMNYSDFRGSTLQNAIFMDIIMKIIELKFFIGADISNIKFHPDTKLWFINFSHAICNETDFSGTDLTEANFSHAHCQGAVFSDAGIMIANFSYADLLHCTLDYGFALGANFSYATWSNWHQCREDPCPYYDYIGKRVCSGKCL